jgi:hypothetical protein
MIRAKRNARTKPLDARDLEMRVSLCWHSLIEMEKTNVSDLDLQKGFDTYMQALNELVDFRTKQQTKRQKVETVHPVVSSQVHYYNGISPMS